MDEQDIPGLNIREEREADHRAVEEITREAFWNRYEPGCNEHWLVHLLRQEPGFQPWHSLVAEYDGHVIGHALFSPAEIRLDAGRHHPVLVLGPLTVLPAAHHRGIGSALMRAAVKAAAEHGTTAILLTGDPAYYHRFGFVSASRFGIRLPGMSQGEEAAFFMALPLSPGALDGQAGTCVFSPLFEAGNGPDFETYESGFPGRQKLRLPGQLK